MINLSALVSPKIEKFILFRVIIYHIHTKMAKKYEFHTKIEKSYQSDSREKEILKNFEKIHPSGNFITIFDPILIICIAMKGIQLLDHAGK